MAQSKRQALSFFLDLPIVVIDAIKEFSFEVFDGVKSLQIRHVAPGNTGSYIVLEKCK